MAAKRRGFTAVSYMSDGTGGCVCRRETAFEEVASGQDVRFRAVGRTLFMPEEEQAVDNGNMMLNAGAAVSRYLSCHARDS